MSIVQSEPGIRCSNSSESRGHFRGTFLALREQERWALSCRYWWKYPPSCGCYWDHQNFQTVGHPTHWDRYDGSMFLLMLNGGSCPLECVIQVHHSGHLGQSGISDDLKLVWMDVCLSSAFPTLTKQCISFFTVWAESWSIKLVPDGKFPDEWK